MFDDKFQTAFSLPTGQTLRDEWLNILQFRNDCFLDTDDNDDESATHPPEFSDWLREGSPTSLNTNDPIQLEQEQKDDYDQTQNNIPLEFIPETEGVLAPEGVSTEKVSTTEGVFTPDTTSIGAHLDVIDATIPTHPTRKNPPRNVGTYKDGPAILRCLPIHDEEYDLAFPTSTVDQPVALLARRGLTKSQPLPQKVSKTDLLDCHLLQQPWEYDRSRHPHHHMSLDACAQTMDVDSISDPRVLESYIMTATSSPYNEDNPSYEMAMRGPFQGEFWKAMETELTTISDDFHCWDLVPRLPGMNILPSTWAFKIKRYPDGSVKKFKARFCARGDKQLEGIDYFETWAPVVQWSTIRIILILSIKCGFKTAQCDITAAFIHATLHDHEHIYVEQPRGFRTNTNHVLCLRHSLYGLKQAPWHFFHYLTERFVKYGLQQSIHDRCLFMSPTLIVIVYVDDILVFSKTDNLIDSFISSMLREDICLRREGTAEGYLGVDISTVDGRIMLTQRGLSERILDALGIDKYATSCKTPAEPAALPKDTDGEPASGTINYASVVGMLLYLSGHTRPDLSFAVHQCAHLCTNSTPRNSSAPHWSVSTRHRR